MKRIWLLSCCLLAALFILLPVLAQSDQAFPTEINIDFPYDPSTIPTAEEVISFKAEAGSKLLMEFFQGIHHVPEIRDSSGNVLDVAFIYYPGVEFAQADTYTLFFLPMGFTSPDTPITYRLTLTGPDAAQIFNITIVCRFVSPNAASANLLFTPGSPDISLGIAAVAAWSPDGSKLAAGGAWYTNQPDNSFNSPAMPEVQDFNVRVYDISSAEQIADLPHEAQVLGLQWSPDGTKVFTWESDKKVYVWDVSASQILFTYDYGDDLRPIDDRLWWGDWSSNNRYILSVSDISPRVRVFDIETGAALLEVPDRSARWSPDGETLLTFGGGIDVWSIPSGEQRYTVPKAFYAQGARWNKDGSRFLAWDKDLLIVCDASTGEIMIEVPLDFSDNDTIEWWIIDPKIAVDFDWNTDESRILIWSGDVVKVLDAVTGDSILTLQGDNDPIAGALWSPLDTYIITWTEREWVTLWDAATGEMALHIPAPYSTIDPHPPSISPDEKLFILPNGLGDLVIQDIVTGEKVSSIPLPSVRIDWSPDSSMILTWGNGASVWAAP